jgi:hypothetical protein
MEIRFDNTPITTFYVLPNLSEYAEPVIGSGEAQAFRVLGVPAESSHLLKGMASKGTISWEDAQSVRCSNKPYGHRIGDCSSTKPTPWDPNTNATFSFKRTLGKVTASYHHCYFLAPLNATHVPQSLLLEYL